MQYLWIGCRKTISGYSIVIGVVYLSPDFWELTTDPRTLDYCTLGGVFCIAREVENVWETLREKRNERDIEFREKPTF